MVGKVNRNSLIEELKKYELCRVFLNEEICRELSKKIVLQYEPIGELGIYSKYFEFKGMYCGDDKYLSGAEAVIRISVTANCREYDIQKAIEGSDCFHNVQMKVLKAGKEILTCRFRLWSNQKEEYTGDQSVWNMFLNH